MTTTTSEVRRFARGDLGVLIEVLKQQGYQVVAPVLHEEVVALRPIESLDDIACGVHDEQDRGYYRTSRNDDGKFFENVVGADSAKRFFFPPQAELFASHVEGESLVLDRTPDDPPRWAIIGLRPCDLAAIRTQDRVFMGSDDHPQFRCESETYYERARNEAFLVVVNCTAPGGNCFCDSWGTGPEAGDGYDLALTEIGNGFLVEAGGARGAKILDAVGSRDASEAEHELADMKLSRAREHMGRRLEVDGLQDLLQRNNDHRIWSYFASKCLGCGNCTMVCPTCFCSTVTDSTELATMSSVRTRSWESCFTHQFSQVTSGAVRSAASARYRHWLTHKLSAWWEQFDSSGCVGCGRCITWCPVGIDWTAEIAQLQHEDQARTAFEGSSEEEVRV